MRFVNGAITPEGLEKIDFVNLPLLDDNTNNNGQTSKDNLVFFV